MEVAIVFVAVEYVALDVSCRSKIRENCLNVLIDDKSISEICAKPIGMIKRCGKMLIGV